jgi:hypothetical protein
MEMGRVLRARLRPLFEHEVSAIRSRDKTVRIGRNQRPRKVLGRRVRKRRWPDQCQEKTTDVIRRAGVSRRGVQFSPIPSTDGTPPQLEPRRLSATLTDKEFPANGPGKREPVFEVLLSVRDGGSATDLAAITPELVAAARRAMSQSAAVAAGLGSLATASASRS